MMEKMIFGRYVPADSVIHKMDPRSKLIIIFLFVCIVFIANNAITYGALVVYTFLMLGLSKVPMRFVFGGLKLVFILILFTFLLHIFLTKEGPVIFELGWFKVY